MQSLGQIYSVVRQSVLNRNLSLKYQGCSDWRPHALLFAAAYDPEFKQLFKIAADFDDRMHRGRKTSMYAQMIAGLLRRNELRPLSVLRWRLL
ncbi:MAG: AAA family ATPase [Burkholderiales bacterium]|nr:AAA family ATPase [Burkholderiales bacterium]